MLDTARNAAPAAPYSVGNFQRGEARTDLTRQWMARPADQRFLSLDDLKASVLGRAQASKESRIETKAVKFIAPEPESMEDIHDLSIMADDAELAPTHWSFGQLCRLAGAPAGYLRDLPSQNVASDLGWGFLRRPVEQVKLYASQGQLLAATGPDYGRIFDHEVVAAVQQVAGNGTGDTRWKVPGVLDWRTMRYDPEHPITMDTTTLYASDRDVFIFLVDDRNPIEVGKLPSGDPDLMFRGFYIQNSEVGRSSLRLAAFYLRAVCCNRMMWGVEGFQEITLRHSKLAPTRFIEEARPALASFAEGSTRRLIEGVERAKAAKLVKDNDDALEFLKARRMSQKRATEILEAVEKEEGREARTVWDFANGITAVARTIPHADERVELEVEAKKLLDKVSV